MLNPIGNLIALDFVMSIFKDDVAKKFSNFNFEFNSNSDSLNINLNKEDLVKPYCPP